MGALAQIAEKGNASAITAVLARLEDECYDVRYAAVKALARIAGKVDVGAITVVGPSPITVQDRTCVLGQECFLDGFTGQNLDPADQLMVLDTCQAERPPLHRRGRQVVQFPNAGPTPASRDRKSVTEKGESEMVCVYGIIWHELIMEVHYSTLVVALQQFRYSQYSYARVRLKAVAGVPTRWRG